MTTDTFPKLATASATIDGRKVTINGIAKGSGMIAPDMATMLAFVFTDAKLPAPVLAGTAVRRRARTPSTPSRSTAIPRPATRCCCSRPARARIIRRSPRRATSGSAISGSKLDEVLLDLALQVVRDGEGAQKLIRIDVTGRGVRRRRKAHRAFDRQFAAGENRHRRQRRQLGPHRHGRRQVRRGGGPRQAEDLFRQSGRGREGRARRRNTTKPPQPRRSRAAKSRSPSISDSAKARRGFGPAISPTAISDINGSYRADR